MRHPIDDDEEQTDGMNEDENEVFDDETVQMIDVTFEPLLDSAHEPRKCTTFQVKLTLVASVLLRSFASSLAIGRTNSIPEVKSTVHVCQSSKEDEEEEEAVRIKIPERADDEEKRL
jgi:hypothetical protein